MLIVGGTYAEFCDTPSWNTTQGSGMRAAGALRARDARLLTAVDEGLVVEAEMVANAIGMVRETVPRSGPVGFDYFTPLSTPRIFGAKTEALDPLVGADDAALVFGLLETANVQVSAQQMVYDPQRPGSGDAINLTGLQFERLALVLNTGEVRAFGASTIIATAVAALFDQTPAEVIVVKGGASGCLIFDRSQPHPQRVAACPTTSVWPLGSGDTFAAGFTAAWSAGADAVEAAKVGSASAAYWCSTLAPVLPEQILDGDTAFATAIGITPLLAAEDDADVAGRATPMVYLAGPFFTLGERWLVDLVRDALWAQGVQVFSPFHDVGLGDESVAIADIEGLKRCSSVIALLDHSDFGTVYETGWAERGGIPVVGYASRPDKEGAKMLLGLGGELHSDLSTAVYRAAWRAFGAPAVKATGAVT
jgi:hypothetical protein